MDNIENCKEITSEFTKNYNLMSIVSDSVYNQTRYAYNSNLVMIELKPPSKKTCANISGFIRQTDKFLKLDDRFCVIEYPFIDYIEAYKAFENLKKSVFDKMEISFRFTIISMKDNVEMNAAEIVKKLAYNICHTNFSYGGKC
jgi:hypothetical protein